MEVTISKERLLKLIIKIIKQLDIPGLYRVSIHIDKNNILVVLWFEIVSSSEFYNQVKKETEDRLESLLGLPFNILTIPYSEAKYHLREPKNI
jgi:hypothetical protein